MHPARRAENTQTHPSIHQSKTQRPTMTTTGRGGARELLVMALLVVELTSEPVVIPLTVVGRQRGDRRLLSEEQSEVNTGKTGIVPLEENNGVIQYIGGE